MKWLAFLHQDRRDEEGQDAKKSIGLNTLLFHALLLKGVGDLVIRVDFKGKGNEIGREGLFK